MLDFFSTQSAKNLTSFLAFKFLNGEASKFLYDYVVPREQNTETCEFSTSLDFAVRCCVYVASIFSSEREISYEGRFVYCLFVVFFLGVSQIVEQR